MKQKDDIILESKDLDTCVDRINECIDNTAKEFVEKDEFLKEVPQKDVDTLKNELTPIFQKEHETQTKDFLTKMLNDCKKDTMNNLNPILLKSNDPDDCVDNMNTHIDDFIEDYMNNSKFKVHKPVDDINKLKNELEPIFRKEFESRKKKSIDNLIAKNKERSIG
eukprot:UN31368